MSVYDALNVRPMINAAGTYTVAGGSRMSTQTLEDMRQAADGFVLIRELQKAVFEQLASMTRNEAAYVSNGADSGLYLTVAACVGRLRGRSFNRLSRQEVASANVVMYRAHRNPYDLVVEHLGAAYREVGFPNTIYPLSKDDLRAAVDENTACILFAACGWTAKGALSLEDTLAVAEERGVPVVVDAAAQLPPVENLWRFTQMGASAVVFSGGKDLRGPQSSGLVLGKRELLDDVAGLGFPNYGIGRMMKVGREELVGLWSAVKQYLEMDHAQRLIWCEGEVQKLTDAFASHPDLRVHRRFPNEAGQPIPRAFAEILRAEFTPQSLLDALLMGSPSVFCNREDGEPGIYINPMTMQPGDTELVIERLTQLLRELPSSRSLPAGEIVGKGGN